jgi:hypothetical protein
MVRNCGKYIGNATSDLRLREAATEVDEAFCDSFMERIWSFLEEYPQAHPEGGSIALSRSNDRAAQTIAKARAICH